MESIVNKTATHNVRKQIHKLRTYTFMAIVFDIVRPQIIVCCAQCNRMSDLVNVMYLRTIPSKTSMIV